MEKQVIEGMRYSVGGHELIEAITSELDGIEEHLKALKNNLKEWYASLPLDSGDVTTKEIMIGELTESLNLFGARQAVLDWRKAHIKPEDTYLLTSNEAQEFLNFTPSEEV